MMHGSRFISLLILCGACARAAEQQPQTRSPAAPPSELEYLRGFSGRYPSDTLFWDSEPLRSRMTRLLGGDYEAFRKNIRTSGPVSAAGGLIYVTGNCPSASEEWGAALLVADPAGNRVQLMLYTDRDGLRSYSDGAIERLPAEVMTTLRNWEDRPKPATKPAPRKRPAETKG